MAAPSDTAPNSNPPRPRQARIRKGVDYIGIESDAWAACPEGSVSCELTDGVDTSVMALDPPALKARADAGAPTGRGGYWQEVPVDSAPVQRHLAAFLASAAGEAVSPGEAGVSVARAFTQVAKGLKVHLELTVPAAALSKASSSRSPTAVAVSLREHIAQLRGAAATTAVAKKKKKGGAAAEVAALFGELVGEGATDNHGCTIGPQCAGRSHSTVNGQMFCCEEGCGSSCSISVSSNNGHVTSVCSCSRKVAVTMYQNWETGSYEQMGHANVMAEAGAAASSGAIVLTSVASSSAATQSA